ncbi:MAG TPA: CHASE2 domain-containing protein [Bryobacteraceae bacterium]|nr:CHASE2 domain-containing protein [Bryobacteraceae bacterium]
MASRRASSLRYAALLAAAFVFGVLASYFVNPYFDNSAYDFMFRLYRPAPWRPHSVVLAIDEATLRQYGGMDSIRKPLADGLEIISSAAPRAVAVDLILADPRGTPEANANLADAFRRTPNLVLGTELLDGGWEDPRPEFARYAAALGHVHAQPDADNVTRAILLEKHYGRVRRWALALEAFRLSRGGPVIVEYPNKLMVGDAAIPVSGDGRPMRVRYIPDGAPQVPRISLAALIADPSKVTAFTGKTVFVGVTAVTSEVRDRVSTPYSNGRLMTGIEVNADAFETMSQGLYLTDVSDVWVVLFSLAVAAGIGLSFRYLPGWMAYAGGGLALAAAHLTPYAFFTHGRVFSFATPFSSAWLTFLCAAAFYHLVVRRNWRIEQAARERYQQAMQFVTHEMRTPLSAIQGSSELISRYALTEEKRRQVAVLINSESKRLARMVEVFLNVERLSAGEMELKREPICVKEIVGVCAGRAAPLAERKRIGIVLHPIPEGLAFTGDRELIEYACYNLLTNAVKYSPRETEIAVSAWEDAGLVRIAVKDQGIGMDQKEVKQIFQKFYRTRKAEESGEAGTGIGLSIVQQIVEQHGGRIEVTSRPGAGSCFTLALPESAAERN